LTGLDAAAAPPDEGGEQSRLPWTWWKAILDIAIITITASLVAAALASALLPAVYGAIFPNLKFYEQEWARYVIVWGLWFLIETWIIVKWIIWRGLLTRLLPLGPLRTTPQKAFTLTGLAIAAGLAIGYPFEFFFPEALAKDAEVYPYLMSSPMGWAVFTLGVVVAPISEEVTFRGFAQSVFAATRLGFWGASGLSSLLWSLIHVYSVPGTVVVFLTGLILSLLLRATNSLIPCIFAHAGINFVLFVFYPEGAV
jgi:hypothetical protein